MSHPRGRAPGSRTGSPRRRRAGESPENEPNSGTDLGAGPAAAQGRHEVANALGRQERRTADQHDQAEGPHAQAGADPDVEDDRAGQHPGAEPGPPDQRRRRRSPRARDTCVARLISQGCQAIQVMSIDWYSRFANARHIASPVHHASPWSFEMPAKK